MGRLPGFDYKRPFFYMVTLKRAQVLQQPAPAGCMGAADAAPCKTNAASGKITPFCTISPEGKVVPNAVTETFEAVIAEWTDFWRSVESVSPHVVMPDHLHLLIKLAAVEKAVSLPVVVGDLRKRLNKAYWQVLQGAPTAAQVLPQPAPAGCMGRANARPCQTPPILDPDWHDWIVKKEGQLAAFRTYILENPPRHARRCANRRYFTQAREIDFHGSRFWAYGNEALLELPVIVAIKGHRTPQVLQGAAPAVPKGRADARPCQTPAFLAAASRIGPGGAGLSTFLSPLEKEAGNVIVKAGGALIVLSMQGFAPRWHPSEKQERLCAAGRMLYLSPYPPQTAQLTKKEMHIRAHALMDWALAHSHAQLEGWPEVLQGGASARVLQGGASAQVLQGGASAPPTPQGGLK